LIEKTFVVKVFSEQAFLELLYWLAECRGAATYLESRVMTHRDCHLPGDVVFLVESDLDLHDSIGAAASEPWDASALRVDDFDYLLGHSKEVVFPDDGFPPPSLLHLKRVADELLASRWAQAPQDVPRETT
jgi:hypothetical protein